MAKLRNRGDAVYLHGGPNHPDAHLVEVGEVVVVSGQVERELADAYVIGGRAYPMSRWELQPEKAKTENKDGE